MSFQDTNNKTIAPGDLALLRVTVKRTNQAPTLHYQWYQGEKGDTSNPISSGISHQDEITFKTPILTASTSYWVRVTNEDESIDSETITAMVSAPELSLTNEPASQTIAPGEHAMLSVSAEGNARITGYQWYQGNSGDLSNPITGGDNYCFTTPVLTTTTPYWVRVSTKYKTCDSKTATVTVLAKEIAPNIAALNSKTSHGPFKLGENISEYKKYNPIQLNAGAINRSYKSSVVVENYAYDVKAINLTYGNLSVYKVKLGVIAGIVVNIDLLLDQVKSDDKGAMDTSNKNRDDLTRSLLNKYGTPDRWDATLLEDDLQHGIQGNSIPDQLVFGAYRTPGETDKDVSLIFARVDPSESTDGYVVASVTLESTKITNDAISQFDENEKQNKQLLDKKTEAIQNNL